MHAGSLRLQAKSKHSVLAMTASSDGAAFITTHGFGTLAFPADKPGAPAGMQPVAAHGCTGLDEDSELMAAAWALDANGLIWRRRVCYLPVPSW